MGLTKITLDQLLDRKKIIPFYRERKAANFSALPPVSVEFHWTSNCNYDCVHCSYGSRRKTKDFLDVNTIESLVDDLIDIGCKAVYLSGGGEPTIVKGWDQFSNKLIDHGIEVALITNGVAIKEKHLSAVRRMNYIAVSVYSTIRERYKKITESNFFEGQFSLPLSLKAESTKTIVGARCVLNDINFDEVYLIYKEAIRSGFDYIIFIPAVDYEGRGVVLGNDDVDVVRNIILDKMELFDLDRTNIRSLINRGVEHYEKNDYRLSLPSPVSGCRAIQIRSGAFVNYDGGVYLCQPDIGNKELEIGNLREQTFKEMWNSKRHQEVIHLLDSRYDEGSCKNCRSIAFSQALYEEEAGLADDGVDLILDPFL
jgi:radical SAM protein with 4Fe4S-binding SPASM domain